MWQQGGGNWPGWHYNWPAWQSNAMAQSQYGGHVPNQWSYPPPQFSENDLFQAAYYSDRVDESFQFSRFDRPPPPRPSRWDQPPKDTSHHKFSGHLPVAPYPDRKENFSHSNNDLDSSQSVGKLEQKQAQICISKSIHDKPLRSEAEGQMNLVLSSSKQASSVNSDFQEDKEQRLKAKKGPHLPAPVRASDHRPLHSSATGRKPGKKILDTKEAHNSSVVYNKDITRGNLTRGGQARGSQNRSDIARGGSHTGRLPSSNRKNNLRRTDFERDEEDESNEINHWLQLTKGSEVVGEKNQGIANKDPLPGSEEARSNAIKEATDRLKQALRHRKNMNLNELLSSGDESKSDAIVPCKAKSHPKNLAELELDASDMRAIGRANTEKTSCGLDETSDDDVIEVERPPTPVHPIIDLDISPTKDSRFHRLRSRADGNVATRPLSPDDLQSYMINDGQDCHESKGENQSNKVSLESDSLKSLHKNASENMHEDEDISVTTNLIKINSSGTCNKIVRSSHPMKTPAAESQTENAFSSPKVKKESEVVQSSQKSYESDAMNGSSKTGTNSRSCIANDSIGATNVTVSPRKVMDSPHTMESKTNKNSSEAQRRRRSSSSSTIYEPLSPRTSLNNARTMRQHHTKSSVFDPGSPPFVCQNDHNPHQKKIINDLKKISQSKLKDLINNPRSGKLDCAMRELMKQHRAVLSKKSRDVAEKLIPAEHLNPKSTDLPPDDSAFLADFAIDWSSLPGELISTLGDLFQDISSETETVSSGLELQELNEQSNLTDGNFDNLQAKIGLPDQNSQNCADTEESIDSAQPARIRVCQFAREDIFSTESQNVPEKIDHLISSTHLESAKPETSSEDGCVLIKHITAQCVPKPDEHNGFSHAVENLEYSSSSHENCPDLMRKSNDKPVGSPGCSENESLLDRGIVPKANQLQHTFNDLSSGNKSTSDVSICSEDVNETLTAKVPLNETENSNGQVRMHKQRKGIKSKKGKNLVHLEERNWFGNSSPNGDQSSQSCTANLEVCYEETVNNGSETSNCESSNIDSSTLTHAATYSGSSQANNVVYSEVSGSSSVEEMFPQSIVPMEKQCLSMLPVLMMTVPANGVSGTVCNMTPAEMEKRIAEIDTALQNLVQERFLLSQALKASQSLQEDTNKDVNEGRTLPTETLDESEGSAKGCESTLELAESSTVSQYPKKSKKQRLNKVDGVKDMHNSVGSLNSGQPKKRHYGGGSAVSKEPKTKQRKVLPGKSCRSNLVSSDLVTLEKGKKKKLQKDAELIILDENDDDNYSTLEENNALVQNFISSSPTYVNFPEVLQSVLDLKVLEKNVFACSQDGKAYWFTRSGGLQSQAIFCVKNPTSLVCIAVIDMKYLYAGSSDGTLFVFDLPTTLPHKKIVMPRSSYPVSNAIHCMTAEWGTLYLGTKAGSVIPFNLKKEVLGEPLNLGGYPVLVIKCCLEGPRKVLVVACRHQPISIRDASSGLLLRSLGGSDWTVYSIVFYKNLVYCGANSDRISIFDFQTGDLKQTLIAGKGVIDMRLCNDYLFSGCYDGKIYVHNVETNLSVGMMDGPGNMVLALGIGNKKIYCSSKDHGLGYFHIPRPAQLALLNKRK